MEKKYFIIIDGQQAGPYDRTQLRDVGIRPDSYVWHEGLPNWVAASTVPELSDLFYTAPPTGTSYGPQQPYANGPQNAPFDPYRTRIPHTNWMPWAIVATVFGCFCSCIGLIFGIIAIVKSNNANRFYDMGDRNMGDYYNSSARTWTIVALVIAGIGIILNIIYLAIYGASLASLYGL